MPSTSAVLDRPYFHRAERCAKPATARRRGQFVDHFVMI